MGLTDHVSALLLCPSDVAVANLRREGIEQGVHAVGDVMFDVLSRFLPAPADRVRMLAELDLEPGGYALATIHRAENTDDRDRLMSVLASLERVASLGLPVVFTAHPRTRRALADVAAPRGVRIIPPASYLEMLSLEASARAIITDSGGVQKEAYWLGVPCITLRDETEWTETVDLGWNVVTGCDPDAVATAVAPRPADGLAPPVYGDGHAADRIVDLVVSRAQHPSQVGRQPERVTSTP